jgi:hypothetical protein
MSFPLTGITGVVNADGKLQNPPLLNENQFTVTLQGTPPFYEIEFLQPFSNPPCVIVTPMVGVDQDGSGGYAPVAQVSYITGSSFSVAFFVTDPELDGSLLQLAMQFSFAALDVTTTLRPIHAPVSF